MLVHLPLTLMEENWLSVRFPPVVSKLPSGPTVRFVWTPDSKWESSSIWKSPAKTQ